MPGIAARSSYFLSGVMQGAKADGDGVAGTINQDYRANIKEAILSADAAATIIEPWDIVGSLCEQLYPAGTAQSDMFRDDAHVRKAFGTVVDAAAAADVIVSYLPEASMGSAVELHAARAAGRRVLAIAPGSMAGNWVVRSYADHVFETIDQLGSWLAAHIEGEPAESRASCPVRSMADLDADAVLEIYQEGIDTGHATFQSSAPSWPEFDRAKLREPRLVATADDGRVIGWAVLSPVSSRQCYAGVAELSLYVRGDAHGQGVGRALMQAMVQASEAAGIWMLVSSIFAENVASKAIHARAGFTVLGRRKGIAKMEYGPLRGQWRDTLWLERRSSIVGID